MSPRGAALLPILTLLALAACDRSTTSKADDKPVAVVSGTVSDAMLQTDRLQAQAPIAEPVPSGAAGDEGPWSRRTRAQRGGVPGEQAPEAGAEAATPEPAEPASAEPTPAPTPKAPAAPAAVPKAAAPKG